MHHWITIIIPPVSGFQVFVQAVRVSCHCGLHSTVVQSRVCHFHRGDLQVHPSLVLIYSKRQSRAWMWLDWCWACSHVGEEELWRFSFILTIPEEVIVISCRSGELVGQSYSGAFYTVFFTLDGGQVLTSDTCWNQLDDMKEETLSISTQKYELILTHECWSVLLHCLTYRSVWSETRESTGTCSEVLLL